jgi:hypothetical protein
VLCFLIVPNTVRAQPVPHTFRDLSLLVKPGDEVTIIDTAGHELRGRITALTEDTITLGKGAAARRLQEHEVVLIQQRRTDSLVNGTLIGAAVGGGLGLLMEASCGPRSACAEAPDGQMLLGGLVWGTAVGLLIDIFIKTPRAVFQAGASRVGVGVTPLATRHRIGAHVTLTW